MPIYISKRNIIVLIIVLFVLIIASAVWFFYVKNIENKNDITNSQNALEKEKLLENQELEARSRNINLSKKDKKVIVDDLKARSKTEKVYTQEEMKSIMDSLYK